MKIAQMASAVSSDPVRAKAMKAGAQFEAVLLNAVFGELERSFAYLPGAPPDNVSKSYDGFGMEALTSGLAGRGGVGLGAFIAKALMAQAHSKHQTNGT